MGRGSVLLSGMTNEPFRPGDKSEEAILCGITLRLIRSDEQERWNHLVSEHHYLKNANMVGQRLCHVAEHEGQWMALLGWSAAACHLKARDTLIGWSNNQRRSRLHLLACNARFCLLSAPGALPNLASKVMGMNLARLSSDWQQACGHPILFVESFVDRQLFRGTSYKASGWKPAGYSTGFKRVAEDFYELHEQPKELYVRELVKHVARKLRARRLPVELEPLERKITPQCQMAHEDLQK